MDAASGKVLYQQNAGKLFVPASNAKLFTSALALSRLGPDYRFRTRVTAEVAPDQAGVIAGSVRLVGGGDPSLSRRQYPYLKGAPAGDPLAALHELADQVVARGVRRIEGDVIGDDTAYLWQPYPKGWTHADLTWEYGAPVSAWILDDNSLSVTITAGPEPGAPASLVLNPPLEYYRIDNRIRTVDGTRTRVQAAVGAGRQLRLWGTAGLRAPPQRENIAIDDPALFAATAFHHALTQRGVVVAGTPIARHLYPWDLPQPTETSAEAGAEGAWPAEEAGEGEVELASRESPALIQILEVMNKVSQNLHTEVLLREVGRALAERGTLEAGLAEMQKFLTEIGIPRSEYHFEDGSGLSRQNLVTPRAITALLRHMYSSPHREAWISLLPVGGVDGTLENRFAKSRAGPRIRAKTGTMSHISGLSGFALRSTGGAVAFSVLANHYGVPSYEIRQLTDRIVLTLLD
jgi:serine-type D-Ala-D-Ala carboxypeptidase/endopeptidase (penicillin-binding protein 4)